MSRILCIVAAAILAALVFPACTTTGPATTRVSTTRDEWGHRPGARGFSTVILDAGHGGRDRGTGSRTTGQAEKDLTLDMVRLVRRELSGSVKCVLTRGTDSTCELDDRVRHVNRFNDAILVSIHFNSGPSRIAGPEVFYWRVDSYTLGKRIFAALSRAAPYESSNRGLVRRRLRLTRNPDLACVLVECGYLSNPREAKLIASPDYRARLAKAIAGAILQQRAEGDGRLGPLPRPIFAPPSRSTDPRE
jgi:N-acetylmuramoyl-L-alanine amidase